MRKADIKVLIVEDDAVGGRALAEIIRRAGFACHWAKAPAETFNLAKLHGFQIAIIDCLLPQMNGVDLYNRLQKEVAPNLPVIFFTGIFKDAKFGEDVTKKTNALAFLQKPINSEVLLRLIEDRFASEIDQQTDISEIAFTRDNLTNVESVDLLARAGSIHGYQLPQVIQLAITNSLSGHLNLIERNGEIANITFSSGNITHVSKPNTKSYFGVLLIEKGLASGEQVQEGLDMESQKPIGERLVELGILSPHMINVVREEQMRIRLSQIIADTSYDVNFLPDAVLPSDVQLNQDDIPELLKDWCRSKIEPQWIRTFFRPFMDHCPHFRDAREVTKALELFKVEGHAETLLHPGPTMQDVLSRHPVDEDAILRALYFLTVQKRLYFKAKPKTQNYDEDIMRLERLYRDIINKNPFEVLGLSHNARSKEISNSYLEMAKALHPDKWGPDTPPTLRDLSQKVFSLVTKAYDEIKDEKKRANFLKALEIGKAADVLHVESELQRVNFLLQRGRLSEANEILLRLPKVKALEAQIKLYSCWARAKRRYSPEAEARLSNELRNELNFIPPEERHSVLYFHVRGLMYKLSGKYDKAQVYFQRVIALDANFFEAHKELAAIKLKLPKTTKFGILTAVTRIFSGKKKVG